MELLCDWLFPFAIWAWELKWSSPGCNTVLGNSDLVKPQWMRLQLIIHAYQTTFCRHFRKTLNIYKPWNIIVKILAFSALKIEIPKRTTVCCIHPRELTCLYTHIIQSMISPHWDVNHWCLQTSYFIYFISLVFVEAIRIEELRRWHTSGSPPQWAGRFSALLSPWLAHPSVSGSPSSNVLLTEMNTGKAA